MIIDFHTHIGDMRLPGDTTREPVTWEGLIARLDDEGIDMAVLLPGEVSPESVFAPGIVLGEDMGITEQVLASGRYPGRIVPFGNLDPRWMGNSPGSDFGPLLRWFTEHGCRGIGEIVANMPFDEPRVVNMIRQIGEAGLPALFHGVGFGPGTYGLQDEPGAPRLASLLRAAPGCTIIGHGQGFWAEIGPGLSPEEKMGYPQGPLGGEGPLFRLMREHPNLQADISAGSGHNALSRDREYGLRFIHEFEDRVLFGTDVCYGGMGGRMPHLAFLRGLLAEGSISQATFDKITWGNAARLLHLDHV